MTIYILLLFLYMLSESGTAMYSDWLMPPLPIMHRATHTTSQYILIGLKRLLRQGILVLMHVIPLLY
jgi:hypothetical protein